MTLVLACCCTAVALVLLIEDVARDGSRLTARTWWAMAFALAGLALAILDAS